MKDGEATVSAGKTAFFPARAGALMGLLVVTGLLSLPLQAAFDPPDTPSAAALPVIDRNFAGVVAVGDDDVLKVAEARLVRVAEGAPKELNPPARAGEGLGVAPEPWPARELSLMERVQDWLARANREFQAVIVRRLSVAPPGGGGDDIAKKLEQVKDEDAEAAQAKQAAEAQRRKEAADALKLAEETRKERERLAADSKRAAEARLAEEAQHVAAKKAADEAAVREAARKAEAESQARAAQERERAERVAEDQKRRREEEHQRTLADAASKAADDAKRAEEAAERQAKLVAAETQRRAEQEAARAAAVKEAEEKARAAAAAREAERERIAREDTEKAAQANAARAKLAEERAKQEAAAKEVADRRRASEDAVRAAALKAAEEEAKATTESSSPVAKDGAPVAFELHGARTVREARNTRLARGPVVKPWMRRVRHERHGWGRCENAGRRISLPGHYVVARGDTLWQIALRHYRSGLYFMRIYRANRDVIRSPNVIYACERLYLPRR